MEHSSFSSAHSLSIYSITLLIKSYIHGQRNNCVFSKRLREHEWVSLLLSSVIVIFGNYWKVVVLAEKETTFFKLLVLLFPSSASHNSVPWHMIVENCQDSDYNAVRSMWESNRKLHKNTEDWVTFESGLEKPIAFGCAETNWSWYSFTKGELVWGKKKTNVDRCSQSHGEKVKVVSLE